VELSEDQNPPSELSTNKDTKIKTNGYLDRRNSQLSSTNSNYSSMDSRRRGSGRNNYQFSVSDCNGDFMDEENDQLGETVYKSVKKAKQIIRSLLIV